MMYKIIPLAELEKNHLEHYAELNKIYAEIVEQDSTQLDKYPINYLMKYPLISDYLIGRIKLRQAQETDPVLLKYYLASRLAVSLFSGSIDEYNLVLSERHKIDLTESALTYDFRPLKGLIEIANNDTLRIIADSEADIDVCKYLVEGLTETIRGKFSKYVPVPSVFMLRGKGASPFFNKVNCACLMIGHYMGTTFERDIVKTSIAHELTHLEKWTVHKLKIADYNIGMHRLLDEGLATQNSYRILPDYKKHFICYDNCAMLVYKHTDYTIKEIAESWWNITFDKHLFNTYSFACAFVNYLDNLFYPLTSKEFFLSWIAQTEVKSAWDYFQMFYKVTVEDVEKSWKESLKEFSSDSQFTHDTQIRLITIKDDKAQFQYQSKNDLYPVMNICCIDNNNRLLSVVSNNSDGSRYSTQGDFYVQMTPEVKQRLLDLRFVILFKDTVEIISCKNGKCNHI
jgi:hypothetical protein